MKKLSFLLALILCFSLCACSLDVGETQPPTPEAEETQPPIRNVQITAGKIEPGMTSGDVSVEVTIDGQPVACRVELTRFTDNGYYIMAQDEPVPEDFYGRLDVYYSLPKGVDLDGILVVMECDGGEYDGTGSVSDDAQGCLVAWSHAIYGSMPEPETEPVTEPATEPETIPETVPQAQPVTKPAQTHTHSWEEKPGLSFAVNCMEDQQKTYVCSCGATRQETIPAPGHDLSGASTTEPTCTGVGYWSATCKRCGAGFLNELPATGHSWSGWVYENGRLHKRSCSVCHAEEEANHTIPSGTVTCSGCGQDIVN